MKQILEAESGSRVRKQIQEADSGSMFWKQILEAESGRPQVKHMVRGKGSAQAGQPPVGLGWRHAPRQQQPYG